MTTATVDRGLAQRRRALRRANEVRTRRAQLKPELKSGRRPVVPLIRRPPWWLRTMPVRTLLLSLPKHGRERVRKTLAEVMISPSRPVGELTERQQSLLLSVLEDR